MFKIANSVVIVAVIQAMVGCGSLPAQPNPDLGFGPSDPGSGAVAEVRGSVNDSAFRPLEGVVVEVLDGPQAGTTARSDARGAFVLRATVDASTRFGLTKDGYVTRVTTAQPCDGCALGAFFGFYLQPLGPTINLEGNYTLTFSADSVACPGFPSAWRTRTYAATIAPASDSVSPAGTLFVATMPGVPYWTDRNSIPIRVSGDFVWFILGEDGSPYFVEEVAPGTYIHFDGSLKFSVGAATVSTISTSLIGWVDLWGPAVAPPLHCEAANHRMTLTKR